METTRYHPVIEDDGDMIPMFFTTNIGAVSKNNFYLEETFPRYYRLISKNAVSETQIRAFQIHCPLCGSVMNTVAAGINVHKHALYRCIACERETKSQKIIMEEKLCLTTH